MTSCNTYSLTWVSLTLDVGYLGCDGRTKHGREELPHVRGQGQKLGGPHARKAAAKRSYPVSEVRGGGREELPHVQGALAAQVQEGLEELSHVEGQEGQRWGDTRCPR